MDHTKYINTYIDVAMATINENTAQLLQLKTQSRIANELIAERDGQIELLKQQIESLSSSVIDFDGIKKQNEELQQQHTGFLNKLSHMDGLLKQVTDMKQEIIVRNTEIDNLMSIIKNKDASIEDLREEIRELKFPSATKVINKKTSKKIEPLVEENKKTLTVLDDF